MENHYLKLHQIVTLLLTLPPAVNALLPSPVDRRGLELTHQGARAAPTCTPESAGDESIDDSPAILAAILECGDGGVIVLPEGTTYAMNTKLDMTGCIGCQILLDGTLKAVDDLSYWNTTSEMILFDNIDGASFHSPTGNGLIDANGQSSYDAFGRGEPILRPVTLSVSGESTRQILVEGITIKNPHAAFVYVGHGAKDVTFKNMDMSAISTGEFAPANTDGFDIGDSQYVYLEDIKILNQDDCVAFKPGCDFVTIRNIECDGSHGLSIGSLAKWPDSVDAVTNLYVNGAIMRNSGKAVGVKIYPGGPDHGHAVITNATWENILVDNCDAGFQLEACYFPPDKDRTFCRDNPSPSIIKDVFVRNMTGTVNDVHDGETGYVYCPTEGENCQVHMEDINVVSVVSPSEFKCDKVGDLGVPCVQLDPYE